MIIKRLPNKCNLRCKHCYASSGEAFNNELHTSEVKKKIIDELEMLNCEFLSISGGEPFVRDDLFEIIEYAVSKKINISMVSNGTYIDMDMAKKLETLGVKRLQISLESAYEEENDAVRGKGAYNKALAAIRCLSNTNIYTAVAVTPMDLNVDLDKLIQIALDNGANVVSIRRFVPMGRGKDVVNDVYSRKDFLEKVIALRSKYHNKIKITCADPILSTLRPDIDNITKKNILGGCSAGITALAIDPIGNIKACTRLNKVLGNVRTDKLSEVWQHNNELKLLRNRNNLTGKCGECNYKFICGGCRVSSFNNDGQLMGADNDCFR